MTALSSVLAFVLFSAVVLATALGSEPDQPPDYPASTPFTNEQLETVHEIRDGVANLRGLPAADNIGEGTLDREVLREFYADALAELNADERREIVLRSRAFKLLGLIGEEDDLVEVSTDFSTDGIAGFYIPREKRMVIIADQLGKLQEWTIAHEYVHSFQDAKFDITAVRRRGAHHRHEELGTTTTCVLEGDASIAAYLYMEERYGPAWILEAQGDADDSGGSIEKIPAGMLRYYLFNYSECQDFVFEVFLEDGWQGVDALYRRPPTTTEQILHPDKYYDGEGAALVQTADLRHALGPGWRELGGWTFGEFDVFNFLLTAGASQSASAHAAAGWGGGQLRLYGSTRPDNDDAAVYIALEWDSSEDWEDARATLEAAFAAKNAAFGKDAVGWGPLGDQGFAVWEKRTLRMALVFSSDELALERIKHALMR
jgi:hypothetical protein